MIKLTKWFKRIKNYMNPAWGICILYSLYRQFSVCHFLICLLKELTSSNSFNVLGTKSHILGTKLDKHRSVIDSFNVRYRKKIKNTSSYHYFGKCKKFQPKSFASTIKFPLCMVTDLSLSNNSSKEEVFSL